MSWLLGPFLPLASLATAAAPLAAVPLAAPPPAAAAVPAVASASEVRGMVDWQAHPAMHVTWRFFAEGLAPELPGPAPDWRHTFAQVMTEPNLRASGVRIFHAAAMAAERARSPEHARALVLDGIRFIDDFVAKYPDQYAVARSPEAARELLTTTSKMVIVHGIEGGRMLFDQPGDAAFWAAQGVSVVTLVHLFDDSLGTSAINPDWLGPLINPPGALRRTFTPRRQTGLTSRGEAAIVELADVGVLVDLSHMSPDSVDDALRVCREHGIPPVVTHGMFSPVQDSERAFSEEEVLDIYRLGGTFALPLNAGSLEPIRPTVPVPDGLGRGTHDVFQFHAETLGKFLKDHAPEIAGRPWSELDSAGRTRLSFGWSSDWNGWTNHTRPSPARPGAVARTIDTVGLAHPGLVPEYWARLQEDGMDLEPFERQAEQFLQMWAAIRRWGQAG